MPPGGSVTQYINPLKAGDPVAAQKIWEGYFHRLAGLARKKLRAAAAGRVADEEDVALSAFASFCRGAADGRFPQLFDRHDLWQLLVLLTARKAVDLIQYERRKKRHPANRHRDKYPDDDAEEAALARVIGREPTPDFAAQVAEECRRLVDRLGDDQLKAIALWKMEGYTNQEIAAKVGRSLATVERKLKLIRGLLEKEVGCG
jgi:DNA-directed RNA polymerase specialized sigma24 family protein